KADWPWWRGPTRNGVAAAEPMPPLTWSDTENILWKTEVPGRGHGSPIVVGDQVFLATAEADRDTQSLLCFDRKTGRRLWQTDVHTGGLTKQGNGRSTLASSTPACDGKRVFINFLNAGAIFTTALDRDGKKLWQTKIADYVLHQGFGSSPALYENLVFVSADNKGAGALVALDRGTGERIWKRDRPKLPNYASPILLDAAGKKQLVFIGCDLVTSLDPKSGSLLWEIPGATTECVTSTVTDGNLVFTSGGYPKNHIAAVRADGSGKLVWESKTKVYVPSMLVRKEHLYGVGDGGVAFCRKADTGTEVWTGRLEGAFTASPILVGERIYAVNEAGRTFVFDADPAAFNLVATNSLGGETMATPAICGGRIYLRTAVQRGGHRQEMLVCIGKE
ncbi:MAG TPA: PQQ-binding-like beta-propeller repeat protein, partial [Gemmataceae bacterium]|nr:PQQ-binding-like beta-propeller repeat protein [Gemmataceae bacterium]